MANLQQLSLLKSGVEPWNQWRQEHPDTLVNLRGANLAGMFLRGINLSGADIRGTNFSQTDLTGANITKAKAGVQMHWDLLLKLIGGIGAVLSGFLAGYAGFNIQLIVVPNSIEDFISGWIAILGLLFLYALLLQRGFNRIVGVFSIISIFVFVVAFILAFSGAPEVAIATAAGGAVALLVTAVGAFSGAISFAIAGEITFLTASIAAFRIARAGVGLETVPAIGVGAGGLAIALICVNAYLGARALARDKKETVIRSIVIALGAMGGTNFREANLTDSTFSSARLEKTDFRNAVIVRTCWHDTENLDRARCDGTILDSLPILDLAVTRDGRGKSYVGQNLQGINLQEADLTNANLTSSDLTDANMKDAILKQTNLTEVKALRAQFCRANLTSACIEAWNIDSTTQLEDVVCEHIYLLNNQQNRVPRSGSFSPDEFSKLFEKAFDTIDLIFTDGIDWQAFFTSFQELRQQYNDSEINVQAIEKKSSASFIVRLEVSGEVDKSAIEQAAKAGYEQQLTLVEANYHKQLQLKDDVIDFHKNRGTDFLAIIKDLSSQKSQFVQNNYGGINFQYDISGGEVNQAETINVDRNNITNNLEGATIGNFANQMSDNASQTYNAALDKSLAEAAQEIQALLDQLSQTYPSETMLQKAQFADAAATQAKANPTLRQRLLSAVDAGTIGAIEELLSHPVATFFIAAVKDWEETNPNA